jgi:hypothetical protein
MDVPNGTPVLNSRNRACPRGCQSSTAPLERRATICSYVCRQLTTWKSTAIASTRHATRIRTSSCRRQSTSPPAISNELWTSSRSKDRASLGGSIRTMSWTSSRDLRQRVAARKCRVLARCATIQSCEPESAVPPRVQLHLSGCLHCANHWLMQRRATRASRYHRLPGCLELLVDEAVTPWP